MNDIDVEVRHQKLPGDIGLVTASGYINNEGGKAIADAVELLVRDSCSGILIDLEQATIINSIGVSILLEVTEKLIEGHGRLAFSNLRPTIRKTFEIMGLDQYSTLHDSREDALGVLRNDESS